MPLTITVCACNLDGCKASSRKVVSTSRMSNNSQEVHFMRGQEIAPKPILCRRGAEIECLLKIRINQIIRSCIISKELPGFSTSGTAPQQIRRSVNSAHLPARNKLLVFARTTGNSRGRFSGLATCTLALSTDTTPGHPIALRISRQEVPALTDTHVEHGIPIRQRSLSKRPLKHAKIASLSFLLFVTPQRGLQINGTKKGAPKWTRANGGSKMDTPKRGLNCTRSKMNTCVGVCFAGSCQETRNRPAH